MSGFDYTELDPEERTYRFFGLFSVGIGIISLCAAIIPMCGAASSLLGLGLGMIGRRSDNKKMATAGIMVSSLGLIISIVYGITWFFQK